MQKTLLIKQQEYQSTVHLIVPQTKKEGDCFNCQKNKPIYLITQKQDEIHEKKHCWSCALTSFYELEKDDYQIKDKKETLKELRAAIYQTETKLTYEY